MKAAHAMTQFAYVNGSIVPRADAVVSVDDRGMLFADAVYEVVLVAGGRLVDLDGHLTRLQRSMSALVFPPLPQGEKLSEVMAELVRCNALADAALYLQIGRGTAPRELSPGPGLVPSVVMTIKPHAIAETLDPARAVEIVTLPDRRWGRCDIKTTALVAGVLARLEAQAQGAGDAWLVDRDGFVTEGCASNAWIVRDGRLITRPAGPEILAGITRERLIALAASAGIPVDVAKFDAAAARTADEAFMTSATALVSPVRSIDGAAIGDAAPGPVTRRLYQDYVAYARGG